MKMLRVSISLAVALFATILLSPWANAQISPNQLNQRAQNAAQATQRARTQVQQNMQAQAQQNVQAQVQAQVQRNVQTQVQQNVQAQVQQNVQAQVQQRVQAQTQQRVETQTQQRVGAQAQQRAQSQAQLRLNGPGRISGEVSQGQTNLGAEAKATAGTRGLEIAQSARGGINTGIPVTLTADEMANLDVVFGEFNPFQRGNRGETSREGESTANGQNGRGIDSSDETDPDQARGSRPVRLVFQSEAELQASLTAAVRQRRAEISSMRDQALAEGDTRKMAAADRMEAMMEAYVAAEARANANANSAINTSPFGRSSGSATLQSGSEVKGQSQGSLRRGRPTSEDGNNEPK